MSNAERQRRRKDRWRRGRACAIVEYDYFVLTEMLIRSGDLEERSMMTAPLSVARSANSPA